MSQNREIRPSLVSELKLNQAEDLRAAGRSSPHNLHLISVIFQTTVRSLVNYESWEDKSASVGGEKIWKVLHTE